MSDAYLDFLRSKIKLASFTGFDVDPAEINPALKPHTRDIVRWMVKGGSRAVFASFGLHKTATQLEALRLVGQHRPGLRLQVLPLGVRQEFFREVKERFTGDFAIDLRFIRSDSEIGDERYSNPGDLVYDPFHGLGTVGVRAIKAGRRAGGSELSAAYFKDQVHYLRAAEREFDTPSLFDVIEAEAAA